MHQHFPVKKILISKILLTFSILVSLSLIFAEMILYQKRKIIQLIQGLQN